MHYIDIKKQGYTIKESLGQIQKINMDIFK